MLHAMQMRRVDRAFTGKASAAGARHMRRHLAGCEACRRRYERHLIAEAALPDGEARAERRLWQEIGVVAAAPSRPRAVAWLLGAALAAAAVALVLAPRLQPEAPVARGPAGPAGLAPVLHVFQARPGDVTGVPGVAEPATAAITAAGGLLFAYSNPGAAYSHLMVFALDGQQRVYWYYPPYQQAGENPEAVAIERGRAGVELREVIRHPLSPGPVRLFALFLPRAERVLTVEAALAAAYGPGRAGVAQDAPLGLPGAHQESRLLQVQP